MAGAYDKENMSVLMLLFFTQLKKIAKRRKFHTFFPYD